MDVDLSGLDKLPVWRNPFLSQPHIRYHDVETCDCEVCTAVRSE